MKTEQQLQIKDALIRFVAAYPSTEVAAATLIGINAETIECILENELDQVNEPLWELLAKQVGFFSGSWHTAETGSYLMLNILLGDAHHYATAYTITMAKGLGKTYTAIQYMRAQPNVLYFSCNSHYTRRSFIAAIMEGAAITPKGTVTDMLEHFVAGIAEKDEPLLIIDDAHKLNDRVMHLLGALTYKLSGKIGLIIMGRDELRLRINEGIQHGKAMYNQLQETFGDRCINLYRKTALDTALLCHANGLHDTQVIAAIDAISNNGYHKLPGLINQHKQLKTAA